MNFANNLQSFRQAKRLSRKQLANVIGVNEITVGYYERGERIPNIEIFSKIADVFNVSADELLGRFYNNPFEPSNEAKKFWERLNIYVNVMPNDSVTLNLPAIAKEASVDNEGKIVYKGFINEVAVTFKNLSDFCLFTNSVKQKVFDATLAESKKVAVNEIKELYNQSQEKNNNVK